MSESAVERANARATSGIDPNGFRCVQCRARFLTASGLAFHEIQEHRGKKNIALVHPLPDRAAPVPPAAGLSTDWSKKATGFSGAMLSLIQLRGLMCHWCSKPMIVDLGSEHRMAPTREHLLPKSQRGTNGRSNIVLVHRQCNSIRGIIDAEAFRRLMRGEALTREDLWPTAFSTER